MNPNFRFGRFSRRTLSAVVRAIAPIEIGVQGLDVYVVNQIESQVRCFPRLHRLGFLIGLSFLEWGPWAGGWGFLPFSLLKRDKATQRLYKLLESRFTPVSLLVNGLRVLVCLSAYGHSEVEQWFGFERRRWRAQRIKTRQRLISSMGGEISGEHHTHIPPTPEALYQSSDQRRAPLLTWESHETVKSPFTIMEHIESHNLEVDISNADSVTKEEHHDI